MSRRPQNLDIGGANAPPQGGTGSLTPGGKPNFYMDLPSPRVGEVPPALSPLDAFALHSRVLARKLEESTKTGRRLSRLPHHELQTELAKRPDFFRGISSGSETWSETPEEFEDEDEDNRDQFSPTQPQTEFRPVSQYPFLGNVKNEDDERPESVAQSDFATQTHMPQSRLGRDDDHGYFGIKVPRSSSPEQFENQVSKAEGVSPALPSLTSSVDSIQSSQPRTLTNESASSRAYQGGLAPPRSPLRPGTARSVASIRSVIDSAEEDNGSPVVSESTRKHSKSSAASNPLSPLSPEFPPVSRSPSAMSELSLIHI